MTKKGLLYAGALLISSGVAFAGGTDPETIRTAQAKPSGPAPTTKTSAPFTPTLTKSALPTKLTVGKCESTDCLIRLDVKVSGDKCEPKPSPDEELVYIWSSKTQAPRDKVRIVWLIDTPDYEFRRGDGIFFKSGASEFEDGRILNTREYQWRDKMTRKGVEFPYKIQVTDAKTGKKCVYDPGIVNDW